MAGAERLLRELAGRGAVDGEQSGRIQQWMCSKQETEECLRQETEERQEQESELRRLGSAGSEPEAEGEGARRLADCGSNAGRWLLFDDVGVVCMPGWGFYLMLL